MSSSSGTKTCDSCLGSFATGQRQGNNSCPVCHAKWSHTPLIVPNLNIYGNHNNNGFLNNNSFSFPTPQPFPRFTPVPQQQFFMHQEPLIFSDDEPLPANLASSTASASIVHDLQKVSIKASAELPAVAASESVSEFAVLVGVKAPSLSDDARRFQHAPIDLVTVLDVSGSMHGSKLSLLKHAVHFVIDNLGPSDRLSIVSFSNHAHRILPLHRMTDNGRELAKRAVDSLYADGSTNIVAALTKGVKVLKERRQHNPVATIIFLSDGNDTCHFSPQYNAFSNPKPAPAYLSLLPASICPRNRGMENAGQQQTFPVHAFGFGTDHDPLAMHAIADESAGTFSFIEAYEMVQDAFASCIGGLLSVVTQDLRLNVRSASHGVEIKSISSGRYKSEISNQGSQGVVNVGDLYADEEKDFLIYLSVPVLQNDGDGDNERKTSLLDITCTYNDVLLKEVVQIEGDLIEIRRPNCVSPTDMTLNLEVDRQRNRLAAILTISQAQQMAERGNLTGAQAMLSTGRSKIQATASAQAGDGLCMWLDADMKETERRMGSKQLYEREGRAYALSGMNSHSSQRATTRGNTVAGSQAFGGAGSGSFAMAPMASFNAAASGALAPREFLNTAALCSLAPRASLNTGALCSLAPRASFNGGQAAPSPAFGAYSTPNMANMVYKSQQQSKKVEATPMEEN